MIYIGSLAIVCALLLTPINGAFDGNFTLRSMQGRLSEKSISSMIHCVSNDGKADKIKFSRVLDTGQGPDLPKYSQQFVQGSPIFARILLLPSEEKLNSFGAFQCQIINGGINTTITTLKLPPLSEVEIDAKEPYISVSKGDNVKLEMIQYIEHNLTIHWRHNGREKPEWENQLEIEIENVDMTDAGIYECYYEGRRSEGVHGLLRLFVRACPAHKFDTLCNRTCPMCYNGGICHDSSGKCICPSGFTGQNCEIACGGNAFGAECEKKCVVEEQESGCAHHLFCKPDPYGCSCPPGYKGPKCEDACEPGRYGADCKQYCHCHNDEPCNRLTGECKKGCAPNWEGNSCQIHIQYVKNIPDFNDKDPCKTGRFGKNCEEKCHCYGGEQCDRITGACKGKCKNFWNGTACNECIDGRFGENCEHICQCQYGSNHCNKTTGECDTGCEAGWSGFNCQEACPADKFGINCMYSCECHNNGHCNKINGTCTCIDKWRGKDCTDRMPRIISTSDGEETNTGQHFLISCTAEAIPSPSLQISSRDIQNFRTMQRDLTTKYQRQVLSNVTASSAGNITFECTAKNIYGFDIKPFIARIIDPPVLKDRPEVMEALPTTISVAWRHWIYDKDDGGKEEDRVDYLVLFRPLGTTRWNHTNRWIPNTSTVIHNLVPDTEYEISVKCRRPGKGGEGKHSPVTLARTQCGTASVNAIPHNFQAEHITPNSITFSWKPPLISELQCSLIGYMMRYYSGIQVHDVTYINISATEQQHTLEGLVPYTEYVFNLLAITSKGKARDYAELKVSTPSDVPGSVQELEYKLLLDPRSVLITWHESSVTNGIIESYRITYRLVKQGLCDKPSNSTNIQETQIIIAPERKGVLKGLSPFSIYNISVQASTSAGYGVSNTIAVETSPSVPSSSPQHIQMVTVNSTQVELSWDPIACEKANGKIIAYEYGLQYVSNGLKVRHTRRTRDADIWVVPLTKSQDTKAILTSLTPYKEYSFVVRAYTKVGSGPFSEKLRIKTAEDVPPPPLIRIASTSNESLTVNWDLPSPPHGIIIKFRFHLWPLDNEKNPISHTILYNSNNKDNLQYTFLSLESYKQYFVKIQAATSIGWGSWSKVVSKWTKEGTPGPPTRVMVTSHTSTSVTISWFPPVKPNGIIKKYKVSCHLISLMKNDIDTGNFKELILDNTTLQATFNRLQPNTEYSFSVKASTKIGDGKSAEISYWTSNADFIFPPAAEILERQTTSNTISIKFPAGHSGVTKYRIIVEIGRNIDGINASQLTDYYTALGARLPYYIAGELSASNLPEEDYHYFVIGDNNSYGGYPNVALSSGILYNIRILAVFRENGREKSAVSEPRKYVIELEDNMKAKTALFGLSWLHFILIMLGVLVLVTIILFVTILGICRYRHIKSKKKNCFTIHDPTISDTKTWSVVYKVSEYDATGSPLVNDSQPLDYGSENACTIKMKKTKKDSNAGFLHINDLPEYVYGQNSASCRNFSEEFEKLSHGQYSTCHVARKSENVRKNRYGNILPYDHSRVVLQPIPDVSTSDYINASHIDGYNKPKEYISTQGPKENTILDFWRMIWQENAAVIVMVTGLVENGKRKCSKYWPDDSILYGDLQILLSHTEPCMDFIIRTLLLRKTNTGETRRIRHYQFLDWPDHTVPSNAASLLTMLRRMRSENPNLTGPIVVHCSAGIGRSGTFIAIDSLIQQSQRENHVNVLAFVNELRMQRTNMVQNLEQYTFIYEALVEAIQCGNTAVMADELPIYLQELCLIKPDMEISELEFQHMALSKLNIKMDKDQCSDALSQENIFKNRDPMVVPTNQKRLKLSTTDENRNNYINAIAVDGYKHKNAFLVTQMPLTHTIDEFWKMIYEYNSSLVVMLNDSWKADTSEDTGQYWPSEGTAQYGHFEIQVVTFEDQGSIMTRTMKLINTHYPDEEPHRLIQLQYMDWAHNDLLPANSASMLALLNQVDRWYRRTTGGPITVHCMDGAERCGVFCAANYICDQLKTEHIVDVFHAVKKIRASRPEFISTLEQYKFCYEVAMELIDSYSIYSNFKLSHS